MIHINLTEIMKTQRDTSHNPIHEQHRSNDMTKGIKNPKGNTENTNRFEQMHTDSVREKLGV